MGDDTAAGVWVFAAFVFGSILGMFLGGEMAERAIHKKAIEHKAAFYHPETGEFQWKDGEK